MKIRLLILCALASFFFGCTSYFDDQNLTGASMVKDKNIPLDSFSVSANFLPTSGLDSAYSNIFGGVWGSSGPCRLGTFKTIPSYAYLEFGALHMPKDFYDFYNITRDSLVKFRGVDSIRIHIHFETNSPIAQTQLSPKVILCRAQKDFKTRSSLPIYFIDTLISSHVELDTFTLSGTSDSGDVIIKPNSGDSTLFYYLDSLLLSNPKDSTDTATIPLALKLAAPATGLVSVNVNKPPQITFYGSRIPVNTAYTDTPYIYNGPLACDSVVTHVRFLETMAQPVDSSIYASNPGLSTIYYRNPLDSDGYEGYPAGYYRAIFKINKDSLFRKPGLNIEDPLSISILHAKAYFHIDQALSFTEGNGTALGLSLECRLYNDKNELLTVNNASDTVQNNISLATDSILTYPIDRFMIWLTAPEYADVKTIVFLVACDRSRYVNISSMNRIVFKKEMKIDLTYTKRY